MPRIQFPLPEHFIFSTEMQIYTSHINWGGHLDNAQLLTLVSEARSRFFRWLDYREAQVEHCSIVVGDVVAQYKSEAFHGETMVVQMVPTDFNRYGFDLAFQMSDKASGREVARGKQGIVFIDLAEKKVTALPEAFCARLAARSTL
ncbi:acyl-CoA thioesterase [Simplicispira psychrophila]|uniref:acyl-CoA thioesterase n=1 Tax=Simplicispira psychrophila TaxID=80882 RepID=UPI0004898BDB|nr:thioesterase family protein [Simplicispira psychrophila]